VEFKPTISAGEQPQIYAVDRAATGTSIWYTNQVNFWNMLWATLFK